MPILIYAFVSLRMVAYYENYSLLATKLLGLLNSVLGSTEAAVGNLIAEGNKSKIERVLWEMMSIRYWVSIYVVAILYFILPPFITLWIGPEYVLSSTVLILIILNIFVQTTQSCLGQFIYGFGLFNDVWATLTQSGIFLILAIIFGKYYGLSGIIGASVISLWLAYGVWKPYFLYRYGFKYPIWQYWKKWIKIIFYTCIAIVLIVISENFLNTIIPNPNESYLNLFFYSLILLTITTTISSIIMLSFNPYSRVIINRFKKNDKQ